MSRPNVVVVVCDTTQFAAFDPDWATEWTEFTNTYAPAPWTLPSHASLFTGTYSSKHGAHAGHKRLDESLTTLPELFRAEGYETVGVSNNTWISEEFGFARGFETFFKTWQYIQSETDLGSVSRTTEGREKIRSLAGGVLEGHPLVNLVNAVYGRFLRKRDDDGARRTNRWLKDWAQSRDQSRPFFLFVNYLEPHLEYRPAEAYADEELPEDVSYEEAMEVRQDPWQYIAGEVEMEEGDFELLEAIYRAEVAYLEDRIEAVLDLLKQCGAWEDTIVVVTSDHGENIGDHGLMDHQYCLYDSLLHVPLVVRGGPFGGGNERDELAQLTDLAPTLLDATGVDPGKAADQFQGVSLHPEANQSREFVVAEYADPQPSMDALRERVTELSDDVLQYDRSLQCVRTEQYKYILGSDGHRELYDVTSDPRESVDISEEDPAKTAELHETLREWTESFEHASVEGDVSMSDDTRDRLEDLGYLQ